jgi:two-component system, NarL family, sensor histidine kinase DesK
VIHRPRISDEHPLVGRGLGWARYIWLGYLVFYVAALFLPPATPRQWAVSMLGLALFLPLYILGFRYTGRPLLLIAWTIFGIGAVVLPFNSGAVSLFIYALAFLPFTGPTASAASWLAVMLIAMSARCHFMGWPLETWAPVVVVGAIVGISNLYFAEIRRHGHELRIARKAVEEMARIAERERIGRDLHDLLGHTLSVIVLKSELASKLADRDLTRAVAEIRDVERITREALTEVRKAVSGYRSEGFGDELANAERVLASAGVTPRLEISRLVLDPDEERVLAFSLREAVTNVVRHASAQHCWITLALRDGRAVLEVRDDGTGGLAPEGNGLSGMRDRLRQIAGTLERDGAAGTRLRILLPARTHDREATA